MDLHQTPFLTAHWQRLAMLNYEVDSALLEALLPRGTELDYWQGHTYLSLVGFLFSDLRVLGLPVPFHRRFEEVNLRFYVRRRAAEGWRRGVVFLKELAPRRAVVWAANLLYQENYTRVPMWHDVAWPDGTQAGPRRATYGWQLRGCKNQLTVSSEGTATTAADDSLEAFITEQFWGYAGGPGRKTIEYRVEHPRWNIWQASHCEVDIDLAGHYGATFAAPLSRPMASAYLVDGSQVTVFRGHAISDA